MVSTSKLALYQPIGTVLADHDLTVSTTTQFHCTNAQGANFVIGQRVRIYAKPFTDNHRTLISVGNVTNTATITNIEANTPSAGVTRLTYTPACSQAPDFADQIFDPETVNVTTALSNQMQTIDDKMDAILCTPGTRPSSPFVGQITVESTVFAAPPFEVRRWNGSIWELIVAAGGGGGPEATGRVAYVVSNAESTHSINTEVGPYLSATFTAQANHTYLIEFSGTLTDDTGGGFTDSFGPLRIRWAAGGSVTTSGTLISSNLMSTDLDTFPITQTIVAFHTAGSTQEITIGVFHINQSGNANEDLFFQANSHSYLAIEDGGII